MPVAQRLKVRLLLKEALDRMQMAATIAGGDDAYAAKRLREISRALDELRTHLAVEGPVATRSNK
ncbi:MAG: hypothetical protein WBX25_37675 [Rhodomicrobium sp.]